MVIARLHFDNCCLLGIGQCQLIQKNLSACRKQCIASAKDYKTELGYRLDRYNAPDDVFICDWYGHFLRRRGRLREAEDLYLSVINLRQKRCARNCLIVIPIQGLALVYEDQGRFMEAEKLLLEGLKIRHKFDSKESLGLSESQNYLGWLYRRQSQHRKAEICFKAALRSSIKAAGKGGDCPPQTCLNLVICTWLIIVTRKLLSCIKGLLIYRSENSVLKMPQLTERCIY